MDLDIKGLRVLVTAGANGIGRAIARAFAAEGAKVHTCDVDEIALSELASSDPAITSTPCDVSNRAAVQKLFAEAMAKLGGLDVLVNNAGVAGPTSRVEEMNPEDWDRCLEICLTGQFNCARLAVPLAAQEQERLDRQYLLGRGPARLCHAHALRRREMGRDRLHQIAVDRTRARTTSASTRSCPALSPATGSAGCWKPRRSSAGFPMPKWNARRFPTPRSRTM